MQYHSMANVWLSVYLGSLFWMEIVLWSAQKLTISLTRIVCHSVLLDMNMYVQLIISYNKMMNLIGVLNSVKMDCGILMVYAPILGNVWIQWVTDLKLANDVYHVMLRILHHKQTNASSVIPSIVQILQI